MNTSSGTKRKKTVSTSSSPSPKRNLPPVLSEPLGAEPSAPPCPPAEETHTSVGATAEAGLSEGGAATAGEYVRCEVCGRDIPAGNIPLHLARCHCDRAGDRSGDRPSSERPSDAARAGNERTVVDDSSDDGVEVIVEPPLGAEPSAPPLPLPEDAGDNGISGGETIGASTTSSEIPAVSASSSNAEEGDQWACPRCTLLNPAMALQCDACLAMRPHTSMPGLAGLGSRWSQPPPTAAAPAPVVRWEVRRSAVPAAVSAANSVLSGAILGSFLAGPAGALVGGAAGGLMDAATRWNNRRAAAARGREGEGGRVTREGGITFSTTAIPAPGGGRRGVRVIMMRSNGAHMTHADRMILQMLLRSAMMQGGGDPEQLTYEELLRRFGVGDENRGASQEVIDALPLMNVDARILDELKDNERTCGICLEDFKEGDAVRKLSCSHRFHKNCVDRWLHQVASCPICKHEVEGSGSPQSSEERNSTQPSTPA